ncbi:puromycin-sensitive aminopeptidase, partial [Cymbomonas tetramitiformis]
MSASEEIMGEAAKEVFRKDYKPFDYGIAKFDLSFSLEEEVTTVSTKMVLKPNFTGDSRPLTLDGSADLVLKTITLDGVPVEAAGYELTAKHLTLKAPPVKEYVLEVVAEIKPQDNTSLDGLYKSNGNFCSQCEAEGFRNITWFPDRPDVMTVYTTRIVADKAKYPVLLSNGNLVESGDCPDKPGYHFTVWEDPFVKPCYLFALVAGNLARIEDSFTTSLGNPVTLRIYTEAHNVHKCAHAMTSLKASMKWDEEVFGLVYDLNLFNIVAVDDFNMGAMENKSLNIFNSRLVLASPETASDNDYSNIEGVVAHEYFHNWTGNRVTCKDWFQLSLKEGLTVFRDQEFSSDMNNRGVKRIADVNRLRVSQFSEDASPMAHPVRPDSYIKMDNFYTVTVYEKVAPSLAVPQCPSGPVMRLCDVWCSVESPRTGSEEMAVVMEDGGCHAG